jgi:hypothetical protein
MGVNTGVMLAFRMGKPRMVPYKGAATYLAGDVIVAGAIPLVAHEDNPPFGATVALDALSCGGGIYQGVADGALAVGQDVFWDATNKKVSGTAAGNVHLGTLLAGPTGVASDAGPAADGDACLVSHDPKCQPGNSDGGTRSEATQSVTATLTAAQLLGGFINSAPAGAITLTLPTAANMVAGLKGCKVGDSFECVLENTSGGANAITLAAGGATLRGGTNVAQNKSAILKGVITNVGAGTEAYTVYSVVGA